MSITFTAKKIWERIMHRFNKDSTRHSWRERQWKIAADVIEIPFDSSTFSLIIETRILMGNFRKPFLPEVPSLTRTRPSVVVRPTYVRSLVDHLLGTNSSFFGSWDLRNFPKYYISLRRLDSEVWDVVAELKRKSYWVIDTFIQRRATVRDQRKFCRVSYTTRYSLL